MLRILFALAACAGPRAEAAPLPRPEEPPVARGGGLELSSAELRPVLVRRYAMTGQGREVLKHLLKTRVLDEMARERRMQVTPADVDVRVAELDRKVRAAGQPGGIAGQLRESGVDPAEFRELMRIAIVQERLCREALGVPPDAPITGDQQEIWIDEEMEARGIESPPPPWSDGVVARCGTIVIREPEFAEILGPSISGEDVRDTCYQLLIAKGLRARMPDLADAAYERAVDAELARRRSEAEADPRYQGAPFERLLSMQGMTLEGLRADPSVAVAALSSLWVSRSYDEQGLRDFYAGERTAFDGAHGEAIRARLLLLRAAVLTNPYNPRSFPEAEMQLEALAEELADEEDFAEAARRQSEESRTRSVGGELGWLTRAGEGLLDLRSAIFADVAARGPIPPGGRILGPMRLSDGVALLWLAELREAPSWQIMKGHVRHELRRRLLEDVLPRESMVTFLDT